MESNWIDAMLFVEKKTSFFLETHIYQFPFGASATHIGEYTIEIMRTAHEYTIVRARVRESIHNKTALHFVVNCWACLMSNMNYYYWRSWLDAIQLDAGRKQMKCATTSASNGFRNRCKILRWVRGIRRSVYRLSCTARRLCVLCTQQNHKLGQSWKKKQQVVVVIIHFH